MRKERTDSLLQHIEQFVSQECPELTVSQLLGYLVHRVNIQSEKVGYNIFTSTVTNPRSFEVVEAIALMHSLTLSREQMRKMRNILAATGIYFPTSNELLEGRKKLRPVISPILDDRGVQVQYKDLVKMTLDSILSLIPKNSLDLYNELIDENGEVKIKPGDFETRKGLTKKPLTTSDQSSITVTHSYINGTTWFLKVLYWCPVDYQQWIERADVRGEPIRQAKG